MLHAAGWKCRTQKSPKIHHLGIIAQIYRAVSSQPRHVSTIGKKLVKQQYLLHMSSQYGELRPTNGLARFTSLGQPCKFQRVSRLGIVTARHSSSGRQPNFAALNKGAIYIRQGDHHVGYWPTFLVCSVCITQVLFHFCSSSFSFVWFHLQF